MFIHSEQFRSEGAKVILILNDYKRYIVHMLYVSIYEICMSLRMQSRFY